MKRILFVDDEPKILQGLQRMLRSHRKVWEMEFVESAEAALATMERSEFDVVVTDMRMPGMDGAALLEAVRERHPGTARIILSGYSDMEAAMRSVRVSHQFLSKPCDADELRAAVDRLCDLEALLNDEALRDTLGSIGELPVPPRTYQRLVGLLGQEEVDLRAVAHVVEEDTGISAKILQLVNSGFFGLRREITSIEQATSYLGTITIRDLVLTTEVFRSFEGGSSLVGRALRAEQEHSLLVARIARSMFDDKARAGEAFLAGLLHDLGKLLLAAYLPERFASVRCDASQNAEPLYEVEERLLTVSHAEIGAYLLGLWGLPYAVVEAVAHHHHPSRVAAQGSFGVLEAVHVADALACELADEHELHDRSGLDVGLLERLGVVERLSSWRELAHAEWEAAREAA